MTELGPVSEALERELNGELASRGIVAWLDKDHSYTAFVDALRVRSPTPVVPFRGSFLEVMLALDGLAGGLDKPPLLLHLPGFNEEAVRATPVLELYRPGYRYRKALPTLIAEVATGKVTPAELATFLATRPTLEAADAWLAAAARGAGFGLAAQLAEFGPSMLFEALGQRARQAPVALVERVASEDDRRALADYVHRLTGIEDAWVRVFARPDEKEPVRPLLAALGAWLLSVEYVHDLRRPPHLEKLLPLRDLAPELVSACCELVRRLRRDDGDAYVALADEVEVSLAPELDAMRAEDLGNIDTFREEEARVLDGAVQALLGCRWHQAREWADARRGERSFWLQRVQTHRFAWALIEAAAGFGELLARHRRPFEGLTSLEEAATAYAEVAFEVDRTHRRFEQQRLALLEPSLPHYGTLREVVRLLRAQHREWADRLCQDFARICEVQGFLPPPSLQQRTLYRQVVAPLVGPTEKTALFLIDAFRFELATELLDELSASGATVDLKPRYAELPTLTAVGMNALAPVARGDRLDVAGEFEGFLTGEFTVRAPRDRARCMGDSSTGRPALLLELAKVADSSAANLVEKLRRESLVIVHSTEIDDAGEANVGLATFETTLRQLEAAWHHLQLAGVKNFVFTADHGFLLQDETAAPPVRFGTRQSPGRRHVVDALPRQEPGMLHVAMSALGYDGLGGYLLFREDTAVFDTGRAGATFVHGGNSPQERIIPVLTVTQRRRESGGGLADYAIEARAEPDALGLHRLRLRIGSQGLGFALAKTIDLALRAHEQEHVRVVVKEVTGAQRTLGNALRVPVAEWVEVFFALEGPAERARVELYHPDATERVTPTVAQTWFDVTRTGDRVGASAPSEDWADQLADEGVRSVFLHLERHGSITEPEIIGILGSPRAFRRFSLDFEAHLARVPFRVLAEPGEGGKRYVRERSR